MEHAYSREEVALALDKILQDPKFAAAPQMSAFLKFVVTQTLDGKADRIKAYTVAVDALGKPTTFDPQCDPSVRVLAKRLRDTISAYYERTTGHSIIVRMRTGSYIPIFEQIKDAKPTVPSSSVMLLARNNESTETSRATDIGKAESPSRIGMFAKS